VLSENKDSGPERSAAYHGKKEKTRQEVAAEGTAFEPGYRHISGACHAVKTSAESIQGKQQQQGAQDVSDGISGMHCVDDLSERNDVLQLARHR
jgi:hypothetical protein